MVNPCGHSDHEYNPYAERHKCCDSRYCRCTCDGAKEREVRYAKWRDTLAWPGANKDEVQT